ncbi:MAG: hypothetical protein AAFR96_06005 [Planctomycetota bacterium]
MTSAAAALLGAAATIGVGCGSTPRASGPLPVASGAGTVDIPAGRLSLGIDAARETLVDIGFTLNRVDAAAGVITTEPLTARGLMAPWERQQTSLAAEAGDALHPQTRTARIEFLSPAAATSLGSNTSATQIDPMPGRTTIDASTPVVAIVTVLVERHYRPGFRPQVVDVVRSSRAFDPSSAEGRIFSVAVERDAPLEARIADEIADRIVRSARSADARSAR